MTGLLPFVAPSTRSLFAVALAASATAVSFAATST